MPKALVCINTNFFSAEEVLEELRACDGVEEAFMVHGVYEIVAKISGESTESLLEIVTNDIKRIRNVQTAHIMLIVPEKAGRKKELQYA